VAPPPVEAHTPSVLNPHPTRYAELNGVLHDLVTGAQAASGGSFVGAYLQGSFAVGDATEFSDCDFIVVTRRDLAPDEIPALNAFHAAIHERPETYWRHALEGSYVPAAILRRWSDDPRDPPPRHVGPVLPRPELDLGPMRN